MKTTEFAVVVSAHATSVRAAGGVEVAEQLSELANACTSAGTSTIATFAKKVQRQLNRLSLGKRNTQGGLVQQLDLLAATLKAAKAKSAASDAELIRELVASILSFRQGPVGATLNELAALQPTKPSTKAKAKVDQASVKAWADKLERVNANPEEFKKVLSQLKADRTITKAALEKITGIFIGVDLPFKSKAAAIKKIEERHYVDTLNESRGRIIDRVAM